jgi:hypothetical protein
MQTSAVIGWGSDRLFKSMIMEALKCPWLYCERGLQTVKDMPVKMSLTARHEHKLECEGDERRKTIPFPLHCGEPPRLA